MSQERLKVRVVPHFMRLHEWIALEEGYFRVEGLEPEMLIDVMHAVSSHDADAYFARPQDRPFMEGMEVANSACEWGSVCNAGAGMGKFVPDVYGVARYAICVPADSPIERLTDLRDVPVAVGLMAGSHFTTLAALGAVLPPAHIRAENVGGPGRRLLALMRGEVQAANLLDPEIPIAEAKGFRKVAQGEFRTLFWVSPTVPQDALNRYFRALRRAGEALDRTPDTYLPLWERNVPPGLEDAYDYRTFGRGELLVFEPYTEEDFQGAMAFAQRWGLNRNVRESDFAGLSTRVAV
jgi:hypothetical protein